MTLYMMTASGWQEIKGTGITTTPSATPLEYASLSGHYSNDEAQQIKADRAAFQAEQDAVVQAASTEAAAQRRAKLTTNPKKQTIKWFVSMGRLSYKFPMYAKDPAGLVFTTKPGAKVFPSATAAAVAISMMAQQPHHRFAQSEFTVVGSVQ
jgi:hypothetical protein